NLLSKPQVFPSARVRSNVLAEESSSESILPSFCRLRKVIPMPIDPLVGVNLKIERAKLHLGNLESEIKQFLARKPFQIITEDEPATGDLVYKIQIAEPIPMALSTIIGDIIHNLRSALDHLAWHLVVINNGAPTRH